MPTILDVFLSKEGTQHDLICMKGSYWLVGGMVFNAIFNNISVNISWRSVLLVEETADLPQVADQLYHIMLYTSPWAGLWEAPMGGSVLNFLKWKVSDTGSAHWASCFIIKITFPPKQNGSHQWRWLGYTSPWAGFELTTSVVIGKDCIGSCKSNYHTITAASRVHIEQSPS
jgi:hypothetical protein